METLWKQVDALVEESGVKRYLEEIPGDLGSQSEEALTEWRSSEQVENGNPSTSISYWDTNDDLEGTKPSELFGKHTWRVENFSQINKRELRGDVFEAGGHKWYILIYPQGCDVVNHVSLFLCVADHDKLLPGWGHFAQFTIAVVNKDPKKSKYSDTLHRFWKKEHDWGWKKFMEISKVLDGFLDDDTFIIKAQVQVIREKVDRPFRCLDRQYRRELVRVYLSNVEQICRKFVEEKRSKLKELIDDKARWSSFSTFWLGMDQNVRRFMSQEKSDVIFKLIVKHFFIEKEVTSTLVMDSLYSGLKALEIQSSCIKGRVKLLETEEIPAPIVHIDSEMFVVVDDVLSLLERAAMEPLPPKDEKGPQNRMKDGGSGEDFNKDSIERDERRLTEMGRRTFESFVLAHIFCKIEVAHQEVVALKRQEELIREEEEAGIAESEQKAKRRATEKEKKLKKKLAKQKRNNRQGKDKGRDGKPHTAVQVKQDLEILNDEMKDLVMECGHPVCEKSELVEDVSDPSDSNDCVAGSYQEEFEERDPSPVNWDTDASEVHAPTDASDSGIGFSCVQNGFVEKKSLSVMDDSSSTCSTDSVPSAVASGPSKGNFSSNHKASNRVKNRRGTVTYEGSHLAKDTDDQPSCPSVSLKAAEYEAETTLSSHYQIKKHEEPSVKKDVECFPVQGRRIIKQHGVGRSFKDKPATAPSPSSPPWNPPSHIQQRPEPKKPVLDPPPVKKLFVKSAPSTTQISLKQHETPKAAAPSKLTEMPSGVSRPASAPLVPMTRPLPPPAVSVQKTPLLARSVSAAGRLGPDPSLPTHSHGPPQSYRNAIISNPAGPSTSSSAKPLPSTPYSQAPPMLPRMEPDPVKPAISFGDRSLDFDTSSEPVAGVSGRQAQGVLADEFPHLDIINDLLEDEHGTGNVLSLGSNNPQLLGQRYSFAGESSSGKSHRTVGYRGNNGFLQQPYGCLGNQRVKSFRDYVPQGNPALLPYLNGQVDGLMQNQWQPGGSDVSLHGMGGGMDGGDALPYRIMEYPQFRSSNGH